MNSLARILQDFEVQLIVENYTQKVKKFISQALKCGVNLYLA